MVVLTGATGFVGAAVALELLERTDAELLCLMRAADRDAATRRLRDQLTRAATLYGRPDLLPAIDARTRAVPGEITGARAAASLPAAGVDLFIHVAASLKFDDRDAAELSRVNVEGAREMARYSEWAGVRRFVHVSTAYVAGRRRGVIREDDPLPRDFHNAYERSKAAAERAVRDVRPDAAIVRPSIVIGHRATGATMSSTGFYAMVTALVRLRRIMRLRKAEQPARFLAEPRVPLNLIPIDLVAEATARIALADDTARVFHLTNTRPPMLGDAFAAILGLLGMPEAEFTDAADRLGDLDQRARQAFHEPYLSSDLTFDGTNTAQVCGADTLSYPFDAAAYERVTTWFLENSLRGVANV